MIQVLDHGYVKSITSWGSDESIIEAARMSTNKGFQGWGPIHATNCAQHPDFKYLKPDDVMYGPNCTCDPKSGDEKLLRYLYEHKHMTPFEMAGLTIEVQAPIFVFREWHRHRTQSYNEMSARYTPLPNLSYVPITERLQIQGGSNKQAQGFGVVSNTTALNFQVTLEELYAQIELLYQDALRNGIPKELARLVLPVARYSRMRASANLRNWLQFLKLRMDQNAQFEIRQYANVVCDLLTVEFPRVMELYKEEK
jgi:thymidylate synthase (FAD)